MAYLDGGVVCAFSTAYPWSLRLRGGVFERYGICHNSDVMVFDIIVSLFIRPVLYSIRRLLVIVASSSQTNIRYITLSASPSCIHVTQSFLLIDRREIPVNI